MIFKKPKPAEPEGRRRPLQAGRQSPAAFSYYAQRSERPAGTPRSSSPIENAPAASSSLGRRLAQRAGLLALAVAVLVAIGSNISLSTDPRIVLLGSSDSQYFLHSKDAYRQAMGSILASSLGNRTKFTINTAAAAQELLKEYPELDKVSVTLPLLGHRPVVYVQPNKPAVIMNARNGAWVLDQHGKALLATTQLPPDVHLDLPLITDQSGLQAAKNRQVLSTNDIAVILQITSQLSAHSLAIASLTLPQAASELDVRFSGQPYFVRFNTHVSSEEARQEAGTFIAVQQHLKSQNVTPGQYIDVRVLGRAYYQ